MAVIAHKIKVGDLVRFGDDVFRSLTVREWARDTLKVEKIEGRDVWISNVRTGQSAKVDVSDLRVPKRD